MESKKVLISLFLAFLMISSIAGFIVGNPLDNSERIEYNGYTFVPTNQGYLTYLGDNQILISSDPRNVQLYKGLEDFTLEKLNSASRIYFTFNPSDNLQNSFAYFDANIRPRLTRSITTACTEDVEGCETIPIITCQDANADNIVIQIDSSETSSITFNNNCLLLQGNQFTLPVLFDSIILDLLLY